MVVCLPLMSSCGRSLCAADSLVEHCRELQSVDCLEPLADGRATAVEPVGDGRALVSHDVRAHVLRNPRLLEECGKSIAKAM